MARQRGIARWINLVLIAAFPPAALLAESPLSPLVATNWQTEQGLPQNSVYDIVQDRDGYLWLATGAGLARFDGVRFKVYGARDIPSLRTDWMTCVYESRSGALWIGTQHSGLVRLNGGVATTFTRADGLPSHYIQSIADDSQGKLWINTSRGVVRSDGGKLELYPAHRGRAVSEFLLQARDGSMWFRSGDAVQRFAPDGSVLTTDVALGATIREARDGSVWVASRARYRVVRFHDGAFEDVPLPPAAKPQWTGRFPEQGVLGMAADTDGELVLLTPAGFVRAAGGRLGQPEPVRLPVNTPELPKVFSLFIDREGNRWVGTLSTGLFRFRRTLVTAYTKDEGLSDLPFRVTFEDREGRMWVGGDVLYWFDGTRFHLFPKLGDIRAIAQTKDGDLWFGNSAGLFRYRSGALTRFPVEGAAVLAVQEDAEGAIWVYEQAAGQRGGLFRFRDGVFEQVLGHASSLAPERGGGIWVSNDDGLFSIRGGTTLRFDERQGLPQSLIVYLYQDASGTVWASTAGGGLCRLRDGKFTCITTKHGLHSDQPGAIVDDEHGNLWFGSIRGIFRLSLRELNDVADRKISSLSPIEYGVAEGMRVSESNGEDPAAWRARDGRLWFSTLRGVAVVDPAAVNPVPPPVVLEEAFADRVPINLRERSSIPPGNNTFDFRFTALSLSAPDKQRFKYRLEPHDKDWVDAGASRTAHYTNMAPGEYSFRVIAANSFGIWNEQGAGVAFVLRPHFYQTKWFYAVAAALFLALLWSAYQFRVRKLQHEFAIRLDERLDERARIARELHDTLLQSFQGLMFSFQAARNLLPGRAQEAIRTLDDAIRDGDNAIAEGRDAIQGLRVGPTLESSLEHLLTVAAKELATSSVADAQPPEFQVILEGKRRDLSPIFHGEIYRIARELLRNAFRHAHASRIEVEIAYDPAFFRLRIRDDGKGIERHVLEQGARDGHWGLPGLRERAKRMGAKFKLWSEPGAGTEAELSIPARIAYRTPKSHQMSANSKL